MHEASGIHLVGKDGHKAEAIKKSDVLGVWDKDGRGASVQTARESRNITERTLREAVQKLGEGQ